MLVFLDIQRERWAWFGGFYSGQLTSFSVQHLETMSGNAREYVIDAVAKFKIFGGAEIAVLVECKKLKCSVERDVVMILIRSKIS